MQIVTQFSVFLINNPGVLAQVVGAFAEARVNVMALTLVDSREHGVLRVVADEANRLRSVLKKLNLPMHETQVLAVELANHAGALAGVLETLAKEHIDIHYAYVTAGAPGGKTTGILHVDLLGRAVKVLEARAKRASGGKVGFRTGPRR